MSTVRCDIEDLGKTLEALAKKAKPAVSSALTSAALLLRVAVTQRAMTTKSDRGFAGFNTGYYARAWKTQKVVDSGDLADSYIRIFNQAPYAGVIEYGRREGKMPPSSALVPWVRRKLGVSAKKAPGVAFAVAKKIGARTIAGRHIITDPAFRLRMQALFVWEVTRSLRKYLTTGSP